MFDSVSFGELAVIGVVALVVIGPKDLPRAMSFVGKWVGKARAVSRQLRSGFDEMVREVELEEMEKKWRAENERILRAHPDPAAPASQPFAAPLAAVVPPPPSDAAQGQGQDRVSPPDPVTPSTPLP